MFQGVLTAMVTPFRDGEVDFDRLRANVTGQVQAGIDGLVPCGTTGESPTLSHEEHDRVIEVVVETAEGRIPIVAGTGSNSTQEALRLTRHAASVGASASLQVCPYYNKPSQEGMYRHFMTIADDVDLPMVLYNIPGRTGVTMEPHTVARLAEHPNIVRIKEATGSLDIASEIAALCPPERMTILSGDDSMTLPLASIGGRGVISVASNLIPQRVVKMVHAALAGDWEIAQQRHLKLFALFRAFFLEGNPVSIKAAMALAGLDSGELRLPLAPMSDSGRDALRGVLGEYGLV